MLKFLKWLFGLFSPYVSKMEKKVDKFFEKITSNSSPTKVKEKLFNLMEEDLVTVNVWLEKKYKGYLYLDKRTRKKMYQDVIHIKTKFEEFIALKKVSSNELEESLSLKGYSLVPAFQEKLFFLYQIMNFLKPGHYYHYIKTASFGKLLRDPRTQKLEGDCNQIVTLYAYLYSTRFPLDDLQIKLLPEHVCLHFKGVDIEATNASFQRYKDYEELLPITEIISTNLLDLSDFRESAQKISEKSMLKAAQLAYSISSLKSFVIENLNIAYQNLGVASLNKNDFETAIFYFSKAGKEDSVKSTFRNAAIYYMNEEKFKKAQRYAKKSKDSNLIKVVKNNQAVSYYKDKKYERALKIYKELNDIKMEKACYSGMYSILADKVRGIKSLDTAKKYKSTYKKMLDLAIKMENDSLISWLKNTLKNI